jgi:hypothetical protein
MQRLGDLFSIILNVVFVFATVSYVASSIGDGLSEIFKWRAKFLLDSISSLLDDPQFNGLARELYNNMLFNPLGDGKLRSKADVSYSLLPTDVDPPVFGKAVLEVLELEKLATEELAKDPPKLDDFVSAATEKLAAKLNRSELSERLHDLAVNMLLRNKNLVKTVTATPPEAASAEEKLKAGIAQITNLTSAMIKETGDWFSLGSVPTSAKFRSWLRGANFAVGLGLAAVLDLQPVPTGGSSLAGKLPYGVAAFQWLVVAASTLLGASFWFEILKKISPAIVGGQPSGEQPPENVVAQTRAGSA